MFKPNQTIAEYSRHLQNSDDFTLGQAFSAMKQFYSSECDGCEDDGLVFLTGVFNDDSPNFQIVLARFYDVFSQLTVAIQYPNGIRSRLTQETHMSAQERGESSQFFADVSKTRAFWLFRNTKPLSCSIKYEDADYRDDGFYARVAEFAASM